MKALLTEKTIQKMNRLMLLGPGQRSEHRDSLRAGWSGDQILVGARFSASVQIGPGAYPAPYAMGTWSFPGVKRPERGDDHPSPSSAEVKERQSNTSTPPLGLRGLS